MKLREALISFTENYELPVIIVENTGFTRKYPSILYLINLIPHSEVLKNLYYVNGAVQLDLNGNDTFAIIFTKFLENEV